MNMYNDFLSWFHKEQQNLKKLTPKKAKQTIMHELLLRGLASPALREVHLEIGPDGKITDASLSFLENQMYTRVIVADAYFKFIKRQKAKKNTTPTPMAEIATAIESVLPEHDKANCKYCKVEFGEEFHAEVAEIKSQGKDPSEFIASYFKEALDKTGFVNTSSKKDPLVNVITKPNLNKTEETSDKAEKPTPADAQPESLEVSNNSQPASAESPTSVKPAVEKVAIAKEEINQTEDGKGKKVKPRSFDENDLDGYEL